MYLLRYYPQPLTHIQNFAYLVPWNLTAKSTPLFLQYLLLIKHSIVTIGIMSFSRVQTTTFLLHRCILIHQWYNIIKFDNSPWCDLVAPCTPIIKYEDKLGKTNVHPKCHIKARLYDSYIWTKFMQLEQTGQRSIISSLCNNLEHLDGFCDLFQFILCLEHLQIEEK